MPDGVQQQLGEQTFRIIPQGIGRIRRKLTTLLAFQEGETSLDGGFEEEVYDLLKTFIPDVPPLHHLFGYDSAEAMAEGGEPDALVASKREPTLPQIIDAIDAIYTVNGADRLVRLGKSVLGPDLLRTLIRREITQMSLQRSPSLPSPSGDLVSTPSTTTDPTSESSEDSLSPDSSISSPPETAAAPTS